jgi:hypothetical protein
VKKKPRELPAPVSPAWREPEQDVVRPAPTIDHQTGAVDACDRPGLEGGVSFWDYWQANRDPNWGMFGDDRSSGGMGHQHERSLKQWRNSPVVCSWSTGSCSSP